MESNEPEYMPIRDWCMKMFGFVPSNGTLNCYVKTNQIYPQPVMFARRLMCHKDAKFIGVKDTPEKISENPLVQRIFDHGSSSEKVQETRT